VQPGSDAYPPLDDPESVADDAAVAASRSTVAEMRLQTLQRALQQVQQEQEDSSLLLPWLVTSAGLAMMAVGIGGGLSDALCDDSCTGPFWGSWLVMGGALASGAGTLWLTLEHLDRTELQRRHDSIRRELQYLEWSAAPVAPRGARAALSLRLKF
jgi:hypothetical protein